MTSYDDIVVGAGSAGCVAAARLSGAGARVLVLEAGPDHPTVADLPPDVADASVPSTEHDWSLTSEPDERGRCVPLPRGRLVGGCSSTNAAFLLRGWPEDYDGWAAAGISGWSFADLLQTFRDIEADQDVTDEWHGNSGPIDVRRPAYDELAPLQRAFLEAAVAAGHRQVVDHNRPGEVGVGPLPRNQRDGLRLSAALTHLAPARSRPGLTIRAETLVDRVEMSGPRAVGVRLAGGELVPAGRVVLAAGSYLTPAILMRSGIGPGAQLRARGLPVVAHLPGVGANLVDHPLVALDLPTSPGFDGPRFQVLLSMRSSRAPEGNRPDLHLFAAGPFDDPASPTGGVFGIVTGLLSPVSRGSVVLRSSDPADLPRVDIAHLREAEDLTRMVEATRHARGLARHEALRGFVTGAELAPGDDVGDDADSLGESIRARVSTYHHPVGTCAMGTSPQDGAVVDACGAVHGVDGVWVADASVMPSIPAAPTNVTTMVVAERIASMLLR